MRRVYVGSPYSREAMREMWNTGYMMRDVAAWWGISVQKATSIVHASPKKVAADKEEIRQDMLDMLDEEGRRL